MSRVILRVQWSGSWLGNSKSCTWAIWKAKRNWGYAKDYVKTMWLMLQQDQPDDYVIATGETHSVREFLDLAFSCVNFKWQDSKTSAEVSSVSVSGLALPQALALLKEARNFGYRESRRIRGEYFNE